MSGRGATTPESGKSSSQGAARRGRLIVISGPSGAGKGTLIGQVLPRLNNAVLSRSATTRPRRPEEKQGREYFFLTQAEFEERVKQGDFIEHVTYGSNSYGTLRSEVEKEMEQGRDVILEIELVGARNVRKMMPEAVLIFIAPPDFEELARRLKDRGTEAETEIAARLKRAREELASQKEFDYVIINRTVEQAADDLQRTIETALEGGRT